MRLNIALCFTRLIDTFDFEGEFAGRSVGTQGGFQAAGTCVAIAFGLVGGALVGESDSLSVVVKCVGLQTFHTKKKKKKEFKE